MRQSKDFLRGRRRQTMSAQEKDIVEQAIDRIETLDARRIIQRRGERVHHATLLLEGHICRYMDARDGFRQLVAFQVPGDFVDLHGYPLRYLDHDIATLTPVRLAYVPHDTLDRIVADQPHLARLLWFSTLLDAAIHREWIFRIGRLDAAGRIAHFLCETHARMAAIGRVIDDAFDLPLTQQDLGEACGLTSVHVNRTLRKLREQRLVDFQQHRARIIDRKALARVGEFDPDYLYMDEGPWSIAAED